MDLENRLPDETVNYSREHPLKELAWLAVGVVAAIVAGVAALGFFAAEVAARLPFSIERDAAASYYVESAGRARDGRLVEAEGALRALGDRLARAMALDPDMSLDVRIEDSALVNAYATLGGQIRVHRGLLEQVRDENALAFVLAHEIAHVKLRHPVRSAGRGVAVGLLLAAAGAGTGGPAGDVVMGAGGVTLLSFSRGQEEDADREALAALAALYGHVGGSRELFAILSASGAPQALRVAMLRTHPLSDERVSALAAHARRTGRAADGARTPLPPSLSRLAIAR